MRDTTSSSQAEHRIDELLRSHAKFRRRAESPFFKTLPGRRVAYATQTGEAWCGDSRTLLKRVPDESVDLVFTSPPYALIRQKEYGNKSDNEYIRWFRPFARHIHRILKPSGSFVINLGGSWVRGSPVKSLYLYKLLLDLCEPGLRRRNPPKFFLAQDFYWFNPAKLPNPTQWVNVERIRVKDAIEPIWWFAKTPTPKASNTSVLAPYSEHMLRLLSTQRYNRGNRPSGWSISSKWGRDNGGSIPPNLLTEDGLNVLLNLLIESNTSSNDVMRRRLRAAGKRAHPATFPGGLPDFFIRMTTDESDVVVDPFCGSNTTGFVAEGLGRQWVSIDSDPDYVEASKARWEDISQAEFPNSNRSA